MAGRVAPRVPRRPIFKDSQSFFSPLDCARGATRPTTAFSRDDVFVSSTTHSNHSCHEKHHSSPRAGGSRLRLSITQALALAALASGCAVGPNYHQPATAVPATYKSTNDLGAWKEAQPLDNVPKGAWWEVFGDETLNALQRRAEANNEDLKAAVARVEQARATARVARSELLPTLDANPSWIRQRYSPNQIPNFGDVTANTFRAPLDLSYEIDLWGRVRRGFESARADAQASLASCHGVLLALHADVAQNYFALRARSDAPYHGIFAGRRFRVLNHTFEPLLP